MTGNPCWNQQEYRKSSIANAFECKPRFKISYMLRLNNTNQSLNPNVVAFAQPPSAPNPPSRRLYINSDAMRGMSKGVMPV